MNFVHPWTRRAFKRTMWIIILGVGIPIVAMTVILIAAATSGDWTIARFAGIAGLSGFFGFASFFTIMPGRRKVVAHKGRVCGNCLFTLEGLEDAGVCPECGHPYEIEKTIMGWERDLNIRHLGVDFEPSAPEHP